MASPIDAFQPAIEALEKDIADLERQWNALVSAVNVLREKAGLPPRDPSGPQRDEGSTAEVQGTLQPSRSDQFYGKRLGAAAREYLEMRHARGMGAAKPREIFEALKAGGYEFGGKDETNQMVVLRTMLRKSTQMFHKLPNGTWGLKAWYPNTKQPKGNINLDDLDIDVGDANAETATAAPSDDDSDEAAAAEQLERTA